MDEYGIAHGIAVKPGHGTQILGVLVALKQVLDALLDAGGDLFELFPVGFFLCHGASFHGSNVRKSKPISGL